MSDPDFKTARAADALRYLRDPGPRMKISSIHDLFGDPFCNGGLLTKEDVEGVRTVVRDLAMDYLSARFHRREPLFGRLYKRWRDAVITKYVDLLTTRYPGSAELAAA